MQYPTRTPGMIELVFTVVNKEDKIWYSFERKKLLKYFSSF